MAEQGRGEGEGQDGAGALGAPNSQIGESTMGRRRYSIEDEKIGKSLIEDVVESVGLETEEATRVTITDEQTGRSASGAGSDYEEALDVACGKLGISSGDIDDEIEEDEHGGEHEHHAHDEEEVLVLDGVDEVAA